jgi:hypothetical protein
MLAATALFGILAGSSAVSARTLEEKAGTAAALQGGARSVDQLVTRVLQALHEDDVNALRALRVTEKEYREIILPGSAKPGEPPLQYAPEFTEFLWGSLNSRNHHGEQALVGGYGGKTLTLRETSLNREREFAGYTSYGRVDLKLTDDQGNEVLLEMGSIAKVGDRYKFVSFVRN